MLPLELIACSPTPQDASFRNLKVCMSNAVYMFVEAYLIYSNV